MPGQQTAFRQRRLLLQVLQVLLLLLRMRADEIEEIEQGLRNTVRLMYLYPLQPRVRQEMCLVDILLQHVRGKKVRGDTASWEKGEKVPLADEQYLVVQHSRKNRRVWTKHCRRQLENFIAKELSNEVEGRRLAAKQKAEEIAKGLFNEND